MERLLNGRTSIRWTAPLIHPSRIKKWEEQKK